MKKKVVDTRYAKSSEYRRIINEIADKGRCPFCPENFIYHKNPILQRSGDWFITQNSWPYANTLHHFVIISSIHKERLAELTVRDLASILKLMKWAEREFDIPGGGFALRFGETAYTGATVCHLHAHLIVPLKNRKNQRAQTVLFPIG